MSLFTYDDFASLLYIRSRTPRVVIVLCSKLLILSALISALTLHKPLHKRIQELIKRL